MLPVKRNLYRFLSFALDNKFIVLHVVEIGVLIHCSLSFESREILNTHFTLDEKVVLAETHFSCAVF